ncbi:MAG TPA: flagellar motor protein MotB [Anaeromyxobacter sp.]|nr:flagellar motor protein MotB [Anaeromyxobacter sp.]
MDERETLLDEDYTAIKRPTRAPWLLFGLALLAGAAAAAFLWLRLQGAERRAREQAELAQRAEAEKAELANLRNELSLQVQAKEEELQKLQGTYQELEQKMKEEIAKGDVFLSQQGGRIKVDLVDKIVFGEGDASITPRGESVLSRVGGVLAAVENKKIQVSGHTDDLNISERLVDRYPTNWELAAARATNVVRFLEEKANVPGRRLVAAAYGPWEPVATNKTTAGRSRNRRIEIVLTPQLAPEPIDGPVAAKAAAAPAVVPAKATAAKPAATTRKAAPARKATR